MELKKRFKIFLSYPATLRPGKKDINEQSVITISRILSNAIKMKATYSGGIREVGIGIW